MRYWSAADRELFAESWVRCYELTDRYRVMAVNWYLNNCETDSGAFLAQSKAAQTLQMRRYLDLEGPFAANDPVRQFVYLPTFAIDPRTNAFVYNLYGSSLEVQRLEKEIKAEEALWDGWIAQVRGDPATLGVPLPWSVKRSPAFVKILEGLGVRTDSTRPVEIVSSNVQYWAELQAIFEGEGSDATEDMTLAPTGEADIQAAHDAPPFDFEAATEQHLSLRGPEEDGNVLLPKTLYDMEASDVEDVMDVDAVLRYRAAKYPLLQMKEKLFARAIAQVIVGSSSRRRRAYLTTEGRPREELLEAVLEYRRKHMTGEAREEAVTVHQWYDFPAPVVHPYTFRVAVSNAEALEADRIKTSMLQRMASMRVRVKAAREAQAELVQQREQDVRAARAGKKPEKSPQKLAKSVATPGKSAKQDAAVSKLPTDRPSGRTRSKSGAGAGSSSGASNMPSSPPAREVAAVVPSVGGEEMYLDRQGFMVLRARPQTMMNLAVSGALLWV